MRLMTDRNIIYPDGKTVFWKDFASFLGLPDQLTFMGDLLNRKLLAISENENYKEEIVSYSYIARSIIKLQSLGVLQCDYIMTLGNSSPNNIDRFHITFFGQKLLDYIEVSSEEVIRLHRTK